jgi:stage II sporulation protein M
MAKWAKKAVRESFEYLKESRNYIYAIALLFAAGALVGMAFSENFSFLDVFLKSLVAKTEGMGMAGLIWFIFQNNIKSAFFGILFGAALGVFPVLNAVMNGIILGYVLKGVWIKDGIGEFWRILPHGIFELPAIFIAMGLGFRLGMFLFSGRAKAELARRAKYSALLFLFVVLPLLVLAAAIEGVLIFLMR